MSNWAEFSLLVTLDFADSKEYIITWRDTRHELLEMLTPGHFIVIFNGQQCNVKEKVYVLELGRYESCLLCINWVPNYWTSVSFCFFFFNHKKGMMAPLPTFAVRVRPYCVSFLVRGKWSTPINAGWYHSSEYHTDVRFCYLRRTVMARNQV